MLYEVGTADVGLASAGYGARAQDASTVFTNPAGMTRLEGSQVLLGAQALYGDYGFSIGPGTSSGLGTNDGGNPIGWFPGGGAFFSYSASPDLKIGFGMAGNFGLAEKYDDNWVGRYYVQEATLIGMSLLPSIAYKATDNLYSPRYRGLLPEDLVDLLTVNKLHYSHGTESGVLFHLIGALSEFGKLGLTAIANSPAQVDEIYAHTLEVLDKETAYGH